MPEIDGMETLNELANHGIVLASFDSKAEPSRIAVWKVESDVSHAPAPGFSWAIGPHESGFQKYRVVSVNGNIIRTTGRADLEVRSPEGRVLFSLYGTPEKLAQAHETVMGNVTQCVVPMRDYHDRIGTW